MELLQLVEKFKNVFSIEKIEDVVDELKLTIDYMQMIFQYYFADRKEKCKTTHRKALR